MGVAMLPCSDCSMDIAVDRREVYDQAINSFLDLIYGNGEANVGSAVRAARGVGQRSWIDPGGAGLHGSCAYDRGGACAIQALEKAGRGVGRRHGRVRITEYQNFPASWRGNFLEAAFQRQNFCHRRRGSGQDRVHTRLADCIDRALRLGRSDGGW